MIQELLGGNNVSILKDDQKPKLSGDGSPSSPSSSAAVNLRCPRCDSSNTKFCYYNNYNLTQPRHFCKTCRRYWTKGGALRNVPIGGGCRKNKNHTLTPKKLHNSLRTGLLTDHPARLSANPNLSWPTSSSSSHHNYTNFLSLLRPNQNPNHHHHHLQNPISVFTGLDTLGPAHVPSSGLLYRNQDPGFVHGEAQNNGLRSSCYFPENPALILGNSANAGVLEPAGPVGAGELGFWNANLSWPAVDLPTTNGAYPA